MKTENAIPSKWMRRISGLLATMMLVMSFASQASAMILFQDDEEHDIDSEGITINADDAGDEDVVLQLGNDGTDATITFDDGLSDLIYSGAGMDWSSVDQFRIREDVDPATNAACDFKGELIYDTTDDELQICTATGTPGTWAAVSAGSVDFESVYATDADDTLTATNFTIDASGNLIFDADGSVTIGGAGIGLTSDGGALALTGDGAADIDIANAGAAIDVDSATLTVDTTSSFSIDGAGASNVTTSSGDLTVSATTNSVVVTGAEAVADAIQITASNAAGGVDINAGTGGVTVDSTGGISLDGAAASNLTTSSGALTLDGNGGVNITGNAAEVDVTTTGAVDINSGAFTLDGSTGSLDFTDTSNLTMTANDAANKTLTISASNAGAGAGYVTIGSDTWNISSAGVATGFTGITSTGVIDFSGASRLALHSGAANPAPCTEGDIFYNTATNATSICTVTGNPGTWSALSSGNPDFEAVYGTDADDTLTASATFDIDAVGAVGIDSDAGITIGGAGIGMTSDGGALALTGDGAADIDIANAGAAIDVDSATLTVDTTSSFSIDGAATASNISLAADGAADDLTVEVTGAQDASLVLQSAGTNVNDAIIVNASAGGIDINADDNVTIDSTNQGISIDGAAASNFTTSAGAITVSGGDGVNIDGTGQEVDVTTTGGTIDMNSASLTVDTTAGISLDGAAASNFTTSSGALTLDGNGGVNIAGNAAEVDVTTTGAVDINSGAFTLDGSTVSVDGTDNSNFTITANNAADKTLTLSATNAGAGDGVVSISANDVVIGSDTWNISAAGAGSGFTTIGASSNITTSAGDFIIGTTGLTETTAANDSGAFLIGTFDEFDNSASTNVQDILDDFDALIGTNAPNVDTMIFEPEYPNYVLWGDGGSNNGKMEALYDNTNREHFYRWTTKKSALHDYDIRFRYTLPDDFSAVGDLVTRIRTATQNPVITDNAVDITLRNDTDNTQCATTATNASTADNTWRDITIAAATIGNCGGQTLAAGDVIEIILKMHVNNTNSGITDVGTISLTYTN